eukprot:146922_1
MFAIIPNNDTLSWHVTIEIPKPQNIINSSGYENNKDVRSLDLNLKIKVIPVLRELFQQDQIMQYLFDLEPQDLINDTIEFLQFAQRNSNISDIQNALNVLITYHNPNITKELLIKLHYESATDTAIYKRLDIEVSKMKKYEKKVTKEMKYLQERITTEQLKAAQLAQQQHEKGKGKLDNIISIINKNSNIGLSEQKQIETNVELTENIVATDGMIGNMLLTLVNDVGQSMVNNMKMNVKINSAQWIDMWREFPQNVPSYFPIMQRVARLGKVCMHELIYTIIEADKEVSRTKHTKRFKFTTLRNHIKQFGHNDSNNQICNYVMDFMMSDMLQHCMQWITPSELYTTEFTGKYNKFHIEVCNKCLIKLQTIRGDKLGEMLFNSWSSKKLRKWGGLISIISPTYPECIVDNFKLLYNAYPSDADGFLFGASYIRFHCDDNASVP